MTPSLLLEPSVRLLFFGGKGGVGKTSMASATALALAKNNPQKRVLVISTDPAHSLSDCFDFPLASETRQIDDIANLWGLELNAESLLKKFKETHGKTLATIISRGTYLDDEDIDRFLELSFPGLDEIMAILKIEEIVKEGDYDLTIVDTAPTGHTLKLFALPDLMKGWIAFLNLLMEKHRLMARLYSRRLKKDEADIFIANLTQDIAKIHRMMRDQLQTRFVPVMLLEEMVLAETQDLVKELRERQGIAIREIIVNKIAQPEKGSSCEVCLRQWESQKNFWNKTKELFPNLSLIPIPYFREEVRGLRALDLLGETLKEGTDTPKLGTDAFSGTVPARGLSLSLEMVSVPNIKFFLFGGKGGVGKTTIASSFALELSKTCPNKKILLFSTDPAHSLSDFFRLTIGNKLTAVPNFTNLWAIEIEPQLAFEKFKKTYSEEIEKAFEAILGSSQVDLVYDRKVLSQLLELAPPGLDEIMALIELAQYVKSNSFDVYILDNAPTGHALRFLELPQLMQEWLKVIFKIFLKYEAYARIPRTFDLLVGLSKDLKAITDKFKNPKNSLFIPVTIPTQMAAAETKRLMESLKTLGIQRREIIVNMVIDPKTKCEDCTQRAKAQQIVIDQIEKSSRDLKITSLPFCYGSTSGKSGKSFFFV